MYWCRVHGPGHERGARTERRRGDRSRGVALVEFAIIAPFFFLIVFGVVDGTRAIIAWQEVKNAAREGAVFAQSHPHQWQRDAAGADGGICDDGNTVVDHVRAENSQSMTVTITYDGGSTLAPDNCRQPSSSNPIQPGDTITVEVEAPFVAITPLVGSLFGDVTAEVSVEAQG